MSIFRTPKIKVGWGLFLTWLVLLGVWKLLVLAVRWWKVTGPMLIIGGVAWLLSAAAAVVGWGPLGLGVAAVLFVVLLIVDPRRVLAGIPRRARATSRSMLVYRRIWRDAMKFAGLTQTDQGEERVPRLVSVRSDGVIDRIRLEMLPSQTLSDFGKQSERLAQSFACREVRVRSVKRRPHQLELVAQVGEPLAASVKPVESGRVDLEALELGIREDGKPFKLRLLYSHLLVGGVTGSGKGSVIWSLLLALRPAIDLGSVKVLAIDPKGGMELALGQPLFGKFVVDSDEAADALEQAVEGMRARAKRLRGSTRKFRPQAKQDDQGGPLIVIVVDEIASLVSPTYVVDTAIRKRITAALSILLAQGRAVGYSVVAATQDVRKETLGFRDAFPTRIALRTAEAPMGDLILGAGARDRGARTEAISEDTPGVGYAVVDDLPEPVRVRFAYLSDDEIQERLPRKEIAA